MTTRKKEPRLIKRNSAQAIVETAAGLIVLVFVAVAIIAGSIDIYARIVGTEKLRMAALAAARTYSSQQTLYGTMLLTSQEPEAKQKAVAVANYILDQLGVGRSRKIELTREVLDGALIAKVTVTANVLIPFVRLTGLPGNVTGTGFDATGFGPARGCRLTIPLFPDSNGNPNARDPNKFTDHVNHLCINFPVFDVGTSFLKPPNLCTNPKPQPGLEGGTFPGGAKFAGGGNVLGAAYFAQEGYGQLFEPPPPGLR